MSPAPSPVRSMRHWAVSGAWGWVAVLCLPCLLTANAQTFTNSPVTAPTLSVSRTDKAHSPASNSTLRRLTALADQPDASQEAELGRRMVLSLLSDKALVNDISLQTYVNELGRWLSLESAQPDLSWSFGVLDSTEVKTFTAPGAYVMLTRGLIDKLGTEAELAAILAHAIANVTQRHPLKAMVRAASNRPDATEDTLVKTVYAQGLLDEDLLAADSAAVLLLARAGFNPQALPNAIKLTSPNGPGTTLLSALIGFDALTRQRLAHLKQVMGTRFDAFARKASPPISQRLAQINEPTPHTQP